VRALIKASDGEVLLAVFEFLVENARNKPGQWAEASSSRTLPRDRSA
jgi:hypothetical protein